MCARTGRQRSKPPRTVHGWTTLGGTRDGMGAACVSIVSPATVQPTARGARATAAESGLKSGWQETMTPAVARGSESNNRGPWFIFFRKKKEPESGCCTTNSYHKYPRVRDARRLPRRTMAKLSSSTRRPHQSRCISLRQEHRAAHRFWREGGKRPS